MTGNDLKNVKELTAPNDDYTKIAQQPTIPIGAIANYNILNLAKEKEIAEVDFKTVLRALALPGHADENRGKIWMDDLLNVLEATGQLEEARAEAAQDYYANDDHPTQLDAFDALRGQSKYGFNLVAAAAADKKGNPVYLTIISDKDSGQLMIVGPEKISDNLKKALKDNGVQYIAQSEEDAKTKVNDFMRDTTRAKQEAGAIRRETSNNITENMIGAFGAVAQISEKHLGPADRDGISALLENTTLGDIIVDQSAAPTTYMQFFKKRSAAQSP